MITVSAAEFQRYFGRYQDEALPQPVMITRNGRERLVIISVHEYRRLRRSDRQVLRSGELSDADLAALEGTRAPESSRAFDHELKSV
jgi:prevent-host-death family protein